MHAEGVDETFAVLRFVFPRGCGQLGGADARGFEELAGMRFGIVAPHLHVIGRKGERLYPAVADFAAVRRLVAVQDHLPMLVDRLDERADIRRVLAPYDRVRQRFIVVYRVEFALEVLFEHVRVVDVLDGAFEYHRLLLGEVD